jgi:2-methylcitrate dehydratase PrpD
MPDVNDREDPMAAFCRMVMNTTYEDLPEDVVNYAKQSILDTVGVTIGGSAMEGIPAVIDFVKDRGGKPESLIPFYGGRVPASEAALALGPMARALDFGQVHEEATHNSEYTVPALLSAAQLREEVSGKEFITAFSVGQEVMIRIGIAFRGVSKGWSHGRELGHFVFGATASVGKLLGLSLGELENAEGIARGLTQPHDLAMYSPGTLMVRMHHGFVCRDAINACLLARRGITGPKEVLAPPRGYLGFAKWETDPDALLKGLGQQWEMLNVMIKLYPCCKCIHTAIDGISAQMREHNFAAGDIEKIDVDESSINWSVVCVPREMKWNPGNIPECLFSLPYCIATAICDRGVFLDSFRPEAITRKEVRNLMPKISAREDSSLPNWASRVCTTLRDGRKFSGDYMYGKGHPLNPLTEQELIDKFKMCVPYSAYGLTEDVVNSVIDALLHLEEVDDVVTALLLPLTPG